MAQFFSPENEMANYGLAMGLLQGSGWSPSPQGNGPGIAQGMSGYLQGRQMDQMRAREAAERQRQVAEQGQWAALAQQLGLEGIPASAQPGLVMKYLESQNKQAEPYTLSPGSVRFGADNKPVASAPTAPNIQIRSKRLPNGMVQDIRLDVASGKELGVVGDPYKPDNRSDASGMRKEFTNLSKPFIEVRDAYARIKTATENPSPAGDIALIFNFMKMLDPGSVVREGEFATAENAAGVPDRMRNTYNRLLEGERLNPDMRADFLGQATNLYGVAQMQHKQLASEYGRLATGAGFDPNEVVVDLLSVQQKNAPSAPQAGDVVDGYRFLGGDPSDQANWEPQ